MVINNLNSNSYKLTIIDENNCVQTDSFFVSQNDAVDVTIESNNSSCAGNSDGSIDISSIAGNASQVLIQFYYEDNDFWAWYWAVDDVKISRKDQNNIVNNSSWMFGENSGGAEYGRTPVTHLPQNWYVGSQVTNDGVNDQTVLSVFQKYKY